MGTRRTTTVIVAVVLGAVASFTLYRYVQGIEDQVYAEARRVEVVVATVEIPKGTTGDEAIAAGLAVKLMPAEFRPESAITDVESVSGKVAAVGVPAGSVVVEDSFVAPTEVVLDTNAQRIPEGMVAITISVTPVQGVAGLVKPGDRVNLFSDDPSRPDAPAKQLLFENVDVLFVGQTPAPQPGEEPEVAAAGAPAETLQPGLITLAVPPAAASEIALVGDGGVYLALVPPGNVAVSPGDERG
ncbi:MAG: Flp pilus assembly protein CpaB [Actinobacteria bacterium]|nr:Flp pilus assembly protein CpaB [Actinomycetota bacterium]